MIQAFFSVGSCEFVDRTFRGVKTNPRASHELTRTKGHETDLSVVALPAAT
jgi:hypothetical protein